MSKLGSMGYVLGGVGALAFELIALAGWQARLDAKLTALAPVAAARAAVVAVVQVPVLQSQPAAPAAIAAAQPRREDGYYGQLRSQVRWVPTRMGRDTMLTPDVNSRMLLARSAAQRAGLDQVGLSYRDVYGIINAETSWVPRTGASKDGTPNLGIAQFEPATARALGLRDPNDLVEAIHVAARHMKEAAVWSAERIARLKLGDDQRAQKLREGVSIYYNLSTRGRNLWNGKNTARLPTETQKHILNARIGAQQAAHLELQARL